MRFQNKGLIFNVQADDFWREKTEFAQSPQLLEIDGGYRVYFSTRKYDLQGIPVSIIKFVDFNFDFTEIINFSRKEVISIGSLGTFDEHGIFPFHVFKNNDQKIYGFISGWSRRVSVPVETSIGISHSDDGTTFKRLGPGPILSSDRFDPFLVGDPFILWVSEIQRYKMWYIRGIEWIENLEESGPSFERVYRVTSATSSDCINWEKSGIEEEVPLRLESSLLECQALPSVTKIGSDWLMSYCYRSALNFRDKSPNAYKIGFAISSDTNTWKILDWELEKSEWNKDMQCYPYIFSIKGQIFVLSNGNNFGRDGFGLHVMVKND